MKRHMQEVGTSLQDAGNAAVVRQTNETKGQMRVQLGQRLGRKGRAANAIRSRFYLNASGAQADTVGYIHSAWWRKSRRGGPDIDMFKAFETGAVIMPVKGKNLAIPLPAAYAVLGRNAKPAKPEQVEIALNVKLFVLRAKSGRRFLALTPDSGKVAIGRNTRGIGKIKPVRFIKKTKERSFPTTRRGAKVQKPILMFLLLKNARLPKRLDFAPTKEAANQGLAEKMIVEVARREPN
jgi:hypothetical protein